MEDMENVMDGYVAPDLRVAISTYLGGDDTTLHSEVDIKAFINEMTKNILRKYSMRGIIDRDCRDPKLSIRGMLYKYRVWDETRRTEDYYIIHERVANTFFNQYMRVQTIHRLFSLFHDNNGTREAKKIFLRSLRDDCIDVAISDFSKNGHVLKDPGNDAVKVLLLHVLRYSFQKSDETAVTSVTSTSQWKKCKENELKKERNWRCNYNRTQCTVSEMKHEDISVYNLINRALISAMLHEITGLTHVEIENIVTVLFKKINVDNLSPGFVDIILSLGIHIYNKKCIEGYCASGIPLLILGNVEALRCYLLCAYKLRTRDVCLASISCLPKDKLQTVSIKSPYELYGIDRLPPVTNSDDELESKLRLKFNSLYLTI